MDRRVLVLVLAALLCVFAPGAQAADPPGPRLAVSIATDAPGAEDAAWEVITTGPSGEGPQRLVGPLGLPIGDALSWSADGRRLAFGVSGVKSTASGRFGSGWQVVATADAESGRGRAFPRAFLNAGEPVISPDGRIVAFQRMKVVKALPEGEDDYLLKSSVWLLDAEGGGVRRLTPWRLERFLEPISFSPDGSALIGVLFDRRGRRVVAVDLHGHTIRRLASLRPGDSDPIYSPDGTKMALVRVRDLRNPALLPARPLSELVVATADGHPMIRLLRGRGYISSPSWDPSGSRIAFVRDPPAEGTGELEPEAGNRVMEVNADGTCLSRVFTDPGITVRGVAWQPGPGREAGPIAC